MNLVICMAGRNTRFHDVGIDIPKYLLPLAGKPIIESIIDNLLRSNSFSDVFLVAHERDVYFQNELEASLERLAINPENLLYIGETKGQAHTANVALSIFQIELKEPVVFHNADTILLNRNTEALKRALEVGRGGIDVFRADSPSYSYVRIKDEKIFEIVEKKVISNWATSGLYSFPSGAIFQKYFASLLESGLTLPAGELYISDVINLMLADKIPFQPFSMELEESTTTLVIGSPEEYRLIQTFANYAS